MAMIEQSDLLRFIEGDCSPEEAVAIQAWIAADPTRGELLDELTAVWRLTGDTTRAWDVAAARDRMLTARRGAPPPESPPLPLRSQAIPPPHRQRHWGMAPVWPARIAAAVLLVVAGAALWSLRPPPEPPREYATAPGQRAALTLPDGSRVLLSVGTRLLVPRDYGVRARAVELEGEAYFTVTHDPRRPFLVRTRHGTTEDLGTQFDVRAYRDEAYLQVVVAAGRVALRGAREADSVLLLRPHDRGVIDSLGAATISGRVSLGNYLAWTRGTLRFDDAPLGSVIAELERWYDLDIQTSDAALAEVRLTISFTTESADEALAALAQVLDVRVARTDRLVRLMPRRPRR
jgi:transmembrane sensor